MSTFKQSEKPVKTEEKKKEESTIDTTEQIPFSDEELENLQKYQDEKEVLEQTNLFVRATFNFSNMGKRNEQMKIYMFDDETIEKLMLNQTMSDGEDINSELLENQNFIRNIDNNNFVVMTRAYIRYDKDHTTDQYVLLFTHLRQTESKQWKVKDMKMSTDNFNNYFY